MRLLKIYLIFNLMLFILGMALNGCNKILPDSGFWKKFDEKQIVTNNSDQGPWGGHRTIIWEYENSNAFTAKKIIDFAKIHDWDFIDSSLSFLIDTKSFFENGLKIEPPFQDSITKKSIKSDMKVLRFNSQMTIENPAGSGEFKKAYGYIFFNQQKNKIILFQSWGE